MVELGRGCWEISTTGSSVRWSHQGPAGRVYSRGVHVNPLDVVKKWHFKPMLSAAILWLAERSWQRCRKLRSLHIKYLSLGYKRRIKQINPEGDYTVVDTICVIDDEGKETGISMRQKWPVRKPRPYLEKLSLGEPLITGQRVIDTLFPIAKGGCVAVPGGFGTGKTVIQHQLAKWSDANIVIYVGCGERGNEMTDVLLNFPKLIDPRTQRPLSERTIFIANTSNMPVARARQAFIQALPCRILQGHGV